jgi:uncharacterized membrane protein YkvA (DUF1232 family)
VALAITIVNDDGSISTTPRQIVYPKPVTADAVEARPALLRRGQAGTRGAYRASVLALANRIHLVRLVWRHGRLAWRLLRDPRTPLMPKVILGAAIVYAFSPLDLMPDFIPFLGQMDDLAVLGLGIELFFKIVPDWLRAEHEAALGTQRASTPSRGYDAFEPSASGLR